MNSRSKRFFTANAVPRCPGPGLPSVRPVQQTLHATGQAGHMAAPQLLPPAQINNHAANSGSTQRLTSIAVSRCSSQRPGAFRARSDCQSKKVTPPAEGEGRARSLGALSHYYSVIAQFLANLQALYATRLIGRLQIESRSTCMLHHGNRHLSP